MKQNPTIWFCNPALLAMTSSALIASGAAADHSGDHVWINPIGGDFEIATNWDPAAVPGEDDTAIFDLDEAYQVLFNDDHENLRVRIHDGDVTFDIGPHEYRLSEPSPVGVGVNPGADATLRIMSGTLLGTYPTASGNTSVIGGAIGASGTVLVTGQDTLWSQPRRIVIGQSGTGALQITDGGTVEITDLASHWIGENSGSVGELLVSGPGSSFDGGGVGVVHEIGRSGIGTVTIDDGGFVRLSNPRLGRNAGSVGTVVVSGEESFLHGVMPTSTAFLTEIGRSGEGSLIIEDGATALFGHINGLDSLTPARVVRLAHNSSGAGTLIVRDPGSRLIVNTLQVGRSGVANVTIENGALVESASVTVALNSGSTGQVTVSGAGSTWDAGGSIRVGGTGSSAGGTGTLTIGPGAIVSVEDTFKIWEGEGNTLTFVLSGPIACSGYGFLDVGGTIDLTGDDGPAGTLEIILDDGYEPINGHSFTLFFDFDAFEGAFAEIVLPELADGLEWNLDDLYTLGVVSVGDAAPPCPGDLTGDGSVGVVDLLTLLSAWGPTPAGGHAADITCSGDIGVADLLQLLSQWGACPE